ncbi:phosphatase PAP2 family protein [Microbacterium sp. LjRoot45]|uniref:Phosphatase PAP2 family protein n=1 Tax=Candidatus Microbacterium phytovorans TaxID=3121374 RepID=A0AAJ5VZ02_9MICO|nr:phosphatase PAP2 family protein [Microbacterium sp.]WEK12475.1 MAG: phosphatase PAP2 family protein [Microbacterium sp.]
MRVTDVEITWGLQRLVIGLVLATAAVVLGIAVALETDIDIDLWWNTTVGSILPAFTELSYLLDFLGGGWFATYVVPLGGCLALVAARRWRSGLYFLTASAVSAAIVQLLKAIFGRLRPEDILVISDHGSFPSGHTANAATIAVAAAIIFPRWWVALIGAAWALVMAFSRTQVHAHWLSDTLGGVLIGTGAALIVAAAFTLPLARERSLG